MRKNKEGDIYSHFCARIGFPHYPLGDATSACPPSSLTKLCALTLICTVVKCGLISFHRTSFLNYLHGTIQTISAMPTYFRGMVQWTHCVFCLWKCTYARGVPETVTLLLSRVLSALLQVCRINIWQDFTMMLHFTFPLYIPQQSLQHGFFCYWVKGEKASRESLQTALDNYCRGKLCQDLQNCFLFHSLYAASGLLGFSGMNIADLSCDPLALLPSIGCMHIYFFRLHFNSFECIWLMRGRWRTNIWLKQLQDQTLIKL